MDLRREAFAHIHLIRLLPKFLSQHPDLELEIVLDDRQLDFAHEAGKLSKHQAVIYVQERAAFCHFATSAPNWRSPKADARYCPGRS